METLVDRVTTAFRERMWATVRMPGSEALRRARAERIWLRLLRRGFTVVARDPELHLYLAMTAEVQDTKRDLFGFLTERVQRLAHPRRTTRPQRPYSVAEDALQARITAQLARLSPRERMVLMARRRERLSYEQIGQRLGCSAAQARSLFARALKTYTVFSKDFR